MYNIVGAELSGTTDGDVATNNSVCECIQLWLEQNIIPKYGVTIDPDMTKTELLKLVILYLPRNPIYEIDEVAKKRGSSM